MIAMVIIYVGLRNAIKFNFDTVNSEYIVAKSKYNQLSYIH
jgi:hypothetical protein